MGLRSFAIVAPSSLGDDAVHVKLARELDEQSTIAVGMIAELDRDRWVGFDQVPKTCPPLHERGSPQILALKMERSKAKNKEPCGALWMAECRASKSERPFSS
jgi:hypothetical protein